MSNGSIGVNEVRVRLTGANIKNNHIYITAAQHLLPRDVYGGASKDNPAPRLLTVTFDPGQTVRTGIPTDAKTGRPRNFLRDRAAVVDFFARSGAKEADEIRIVRTASHTLSISLLRGP